MKLHSEPIKRAAAPADANRSHHNPTIDDVVEWVVSQIELGITVDYDQVESDHARLMPELAQRLDTLRQLNSIRVAAHAEQGSASFDCDPADELLDEDLRYLQEALHAYHFLDRVHQGGQGVVYKAIQKSMHRVVAVKILLNGPLATQQQKQRFRREMQLCARLRHPHIVSIHESGTIRGRHYYTMDFVDGLPIADYVLLHQPSVRDMIRLYVKVCRAVHHAHQHGVIHRDLKPSNILIDSAGEPHILDFGLAKDFLYDNQPDISMTGQIVGTLPYLSPEQAKGHSPDVDIRTDIYSLGIILYELLAGRLPYDITGPGSVVRDHIVTQEPPRLRSVVACPNYDGHLKARDIDADLEAILYKALEKSRQRRYQSADAFARDLEKYESGEAVEARSDQRLYLLKKVLHRYRKQAVALVAAMLLVLAGLIGASVQWQREARLRQMYQSGLNMGSLVRLGSVDRDMGRVDQAAAMYQRAIEIGNSIPHPDRAITAFHFAAFQHLAETYISQGRPEKAQALTTEAVGIANEMLDNNPGDEEAIRFLGFCHRLMGRIHMSQNNWKAATLDLEKAADIRRTLATRYPDNTSLQSELASICGLMGKCARMLDQYDDALGHYREAYHIEKRLYEQNPASVDNVINLLNCQNRLTVWHMSQHKPGHDQLAKKLLEESDSILSQFTASHTGAARSADLNKLIAASQSNRSILLKRLTDAPHDSSD